MMFYLERKISFDPLGSRILMVSEKEKGFVLCCI